MGLIDEFRDMWAYATQFIALSSIFYPTMWFNSPNAYSVSSLTGEDKMQENRSHHTSLNYDA